MALISSGCGIGVDVGIAVNVEVGSRVRVGAGVKVWVGEAVGDESGEAEFVPTQAERRIDNIHTMPVSFVLCMGLIFTGLPVLVSDIRRDGRAMTLAFQHSFGKPLKPLEAGFSFYAGSEAFDIFPKFYP